MISVLKVLEPIEPVIPELNLPKLKEGSIIPSTNSRTGIPVKSWEKHNIFVRKVSRDPAMMLYDMPDVPMDIDYL